MCLNLWKNSSSHGVISVFSAAPNVPLQNEDEDEYDDGLEDMHHGDWIICERNVKQEQV